jgi:AbrB family looped-hinge helix DNA binding protein
MTIVHMSEKGQIVVPKNIRDEHGFRNGSAFAVLDTKSGAIMFRPVKTAPKNGFG